MAKRKIAPSLPSRSTKRSKSRQDKPLEDLTHGPSIREQAEPYRLTTAKFPLDALTSAWSVGSNRPLNSEHVAALGQIFKKQRLQREPEQNRLRIACSQAEVRRMMEHLGQASERPVETASSWPSFRDWMSVNRCPAEIMAGQHRVEALKAFILKNRLHTSTDEDPHWWLCDIYDKDELPAKLNFLLRANRLDHTLPDNHGQVWMQLTTLAHQDPKLFQGTNKQVEDEMEAIANLGGREEFPTRRMVTLWKNHSWKAMITQWCSTAVGRSTFNISLWADLARFRIDDFWFDRLEVALQQISELCAESPQSIQLSDWMALVALPRPRSPKDVQDLFYPHAPTDALADPEDHGHQHRRGGFLTALTYPQYYAAYRFVLEHPEEIFLKIEAVLRAGRTEGKIISPVISHIVQWINLQPTQPADRDNNKPPLWRDFIPALQAQHGSEAQHQARLLQRQIFDVVRGRLDDLKGSLEDKVGQDSYLDRFSSPIWHDLLVAVRTAVGPQFQGTLARFNREIPDSHVCQAAPALPADLGRAICRLPQVSRNPALKASLAVEELMKRISPIVIEWAAQQCKQALEAQDLRKAPAWPPSILELVRAEHLSFCELVRADPPASLQKRGGVSPTPPRSLSSGTPGPGLVESIETPPEPTTDMSEDAYLPPSTAEPLPGSGPMSTSLDLNETEINRRRKALRADHRRKATARSSSGASWTPPLTTMGRLEQERLRPPVKAVQASWMSRPAARSNWG